MCELVIFALKCLLCWSVKFIMKQQISLLREQLRPVFVSLLVPVMNSGFESSGLEMDDLSPRGNSGRRETVLSQRNYAA